MDDLPTGDAVGVRDRATGALFFAGFGSVWTFLGLVQTNRATPHMLISAGVTTVCLLGWALLLMLRTRELRRRAATQAGRGERERRMFAAVNIIQGVSIATAFAILGLLGMPQYIAPAVAVIVGLHLFPLAAPFRNAQHYVTGSLLVIWAGCCLLWEPPTHVSGAAALGAGVILLGSAAATLVRQRSPFRSAAALPISAEGSAAR